MPVIRELQVSLETPTYLLAEESYDSQHYKMAMQANSFAFTEFLYALYEYIYILLYIYYSIILYILYVPLVLVSMVIAG